MGLGRFHDQGADGKFQLPRLIPPDVSRPGNIYGFLGETIWVRLFSDSPICLVIDQQQLSSVGRFARAAGAPNPRTL